MRHGHAVIQVIFLNMHVRSGRISLEGKRSGSESLEKIEPFRYFNNVVFQRILRGNGGALDIASSSVKMCEYAARSLCQTVCYIAIFEFFSE